MTNFTTKNTKDRQLAVFGIILGGLLTLLPSAILAQEANTWIIRVVDASNNALSDITVKTNICQKEFTGVTDEQGFLKYEKTSLEGCDEVSISIQNPLYEPLDTIVSLTDAGYTLLTLLPITLEEVGVVGYRQIAHHSAEKTVLKVDTKGLLKSAKANLALMRMPNIIYSDESYYIVGQTQAAQILINGIEASSEDIKRIDAKDVDYVELLPIGLNDEQPGGRINIVLKKNLPSMYRGETQLSTNLLSPMGRISPTFIYRAKAFDLMSWGSYVNNKQKSRFYTDRNGQNILSSRREPHLQQYSFTSRANLIISPQWRTGFSYSYFGFKSPTDMYWTLNGVPQIDKKITEKYSTSTADLILRYSKNRNTRSFLKARYRDYNSQNNSSPPIVNFKGRMKEWTGEYSQELDSLLLLGKSNNLATGYRSIYRRSTLTSSQTKYNNQVQQLYVKNSVNITEGLSLLLLLRGEWESYKFDHRASTQNFSFLPTTSVNYSGTIGTISSTFSRKIDRPSVDYLSPDTVYIDDLEQTRGNPFLKPQYENRYSIQYSKQIQNSYLSLVSSFASTKNLISNIFLDNYNVSTYENIGKKRNFSFLVSYYKPFLNNMLVFNATAGTGYTRYKIEALSHGSPLVSPRNGWYFTNSLYLSYLMPKGWFVSASMNYTNRQLELNTVLRERPFISLSATKSLLQDKLELSINYMDLFRLYAKQRIEYNFRNMAQSSTRYLSTSMLTISVTYRFGKQFVSRGTGTFIETDDITTK